jgi:ATP-dependent exoDNAse (exonuclease V) beta subunit
VERYRTQVTVYADALSRIYELPVKKKYLYFFRLGHLAEI